jgi:outer membrane immunogenic protein
MRCLLVALGLTGLLSPAFAADYPSFDPPTLRGSDTFVPAYPSYFRWDGLYAGGQLSYSSSTSDFSGATQPLVAFSLRNSTELALMQADQWQVLGTRSTGAAGFGGFVGYNFQIDNAIIGLELNYTHTSLNAGAPSSPMARSITSNGVITVHEVDASGSQNISDFVTTRARFGWAIGNFMPYATLGLAFGRADMALSTLFTETLINAFTGQTLASASILQSQAKNGNYLYGYAAGGGLEVALTQNIFARGEYEFIDFQRPWQIATTMHNFRTGLGVRF